MWVTAYVDASFKEKGTWAVWLRSESGRIVEHGQCPVEVWDNIRAEFYAAIKAVEIAVERWPHTTGVLIVSDCQTVVDYTPHLAEDARGDLRTLQRQIRKALGGRFVRTKKIKGHQDPRRGVGAYLNNQVDKLAGNAHR